MNLFKTFFASFSQKVVNQKEVVALSNLKYLKKISLLLVAFAIFIGCSSSNDPNDANLLAGTTWISEYELPWLTGRGNYLFATETTGTWKATLAGLTIPFTTMPFTYSYRNKKITITYTGNGEKEVGSVSGNTMILTKENGTVINYKKE